MELPYKSQLTSHPHRGASTSLHGAQQQCRDVTPRPRASSMAMTSSHTAELCSIKCCVTSRYTAERGMSIVIYTVSGFYHYVDLHLFWSWECCLVFLPRFLKVKAGEDPVRKRLGEVILSRYSLAKDRSCVFQQSFLLFQLCSRWLQSSTPSNLIFVWILVNDHYLYALSVGFLGGSCLLNANGGLESRYGSVYLFSSPSRWCGFISCPCPW